MSSQWTLRRMALWVLSLLVFNGTTVLTKLCADAPTQAQIVLQSERDGNGEIYVIDVDGSNLRNLTNHHANDRHPSWSPDGQFIAFSTNLNGGGNQYEIWIMEADGGHPRPLIQGRVQVLGRVRGSYPAWSPNGQYIVYSSVGDIYILPLGGEVSRRLALEPGRSSRPSWSPDSRRIVFYRDQGVRNRDLVVVDVNGGQEHDLNVVERGPPYDPAWSPDGRSIAFSWTEDQQRKIYVVDADGGG